MIQRKSVMNSVLDRQEIEVVRAKYIKEITVTVDPNREIAFGNDKVRLHEVEAWLSRRPEAILVG